MTHREWSDPSSAFYMPQPSKPVRLADMTYMALMEARRIRENEDLCVRVGLRKEPRPEEIRRAEIFEASYRFLEKLQPVLSPVLDLVKRAKAKDETEVERGHDGGERRAV